MIETCLWSNGTPEQPALPPELHWWQVRPIGGSQLPMEKHSTFLLPNLTPVHWMMPTQMFSIASLLAWKSFCVEDSSSQLSFLFLGCAGQGWHLVPIVLSLNPYNNHLSHGFTWGLGRRLRVRSTGCSSRELRFGSQHPHGSLQPFAARVTGDPMPPSGLSEYCIHVIHKHTCRETTHTHKKLKNYLN